MTEKKNWAERVASLTAPELSPSVLTLILLIAGPTLSFLILPLEGEFWVSRIPDSPLNRFRGYAFPWFLDFLGGLLVYSWGRLRQTARRDSKQWKLARWILPFAVFIAVASCVISFQQLGNIDSATHWALTLFNSAITPIVQIGIGLAQAGIDGNFEVETSDSEVNTKKPKLKSGKPSVEWWRSVYSKLDGERERMTPERVQELVLSEWSSSPSGTTLYNWSDECKESVQEQVN